MPVAGALEELGVKEPSSALIWWLTADGVRHKLVLRPP